MHRRFIDPQQTSSAARVRELVKARDREGLAKEFPVSTLLAIPAPERNKIAVLLAETLLLTDGLPAMAPEAFMAYLQANPEASRNPIYGLKSLAIELLLVLAEQRTLTAPEVLPGLIAALAHPYHAIARDSHRALVALTGHTTGMQWPYWPHMPPDVPTRTEVLTWWQEWWKKNKDRQPIFTPALETRLKQAISRLASAIATDLKEKQPGKFPELVRFTVQPNAVERRNIEFFPLHWHRSPLGVKESLDIFIRIRSLFGTPDLLSSQQGGGWAEGRDPLVSSEQQEVVGLRKVRQRLYGGYLPGTDLRIEVEMATHNTALMNAARTLLAKTANTEGLVVAPRTAREPNANAGGFWAVYSGPGKTETPGEALQRQRFSALCDAVESADVKAVERAFSGGARYPAADLGGLVITCIGEAYDPLQPDHALKRERFRAIARLLLQRGADPNERDANHGTALHHAALYGDVALCTVLLDRKADMYAQDKVNETPLTIAATFNQAQVAELLIRRGVDLRRYGREALWTAAYNDGYATVELLVKHGVDPMARDPKGRTAEDLAKERGFVQSARRIAALTRITRRKR